MCHVLRTQKVRSKTSFAAHLFVVGFLASLRGMWCGVQYCQCGNVAFCQYCQLPICHAALIGNWKLKLATTLSAIALAAADCTLATFYNAPTLHLPKSHYLANHRHQFSTLLEVYPQKFCDSIPNSQQNLTPSFPLS